MSSANTKTSIHWREELASSVIHPRDLPQPLQDGCRNMEAVLARYPMRIPPHFLSLIEQGHDGIGKQVFPDLEELDATALPEDPLHENRQSPVPGLIHRYPDRVLFLVSNECAVYCRYCLRKRMVGRPFSVNSRTRKEALDYIEKTPAVREVILSGGDPLMLDTETLGLLLERIRSFPHVEVLRIHTRIPGVLPSRITDGLVDRLKQHHPLFINIQFNHPNEITPQTTLACAKLADAGIPLGSQTVLLKGVNDDPDVMMRLMQKLLSIRVRPYYLHHPDLVKGTGHFRIPVATGLSILKHLQGRISGMAIPRYVIDLPGGGGKTALLPESVAGEENGRLKVVGLGGKVYEYPKEA
jgi:lysine 2,3-aminomutase